MLTASSCLGYSERHTGPVFCALWGVHFQEHVPVGVREWIPSVSGGGAIPLPDTHRHIFLGVDTPKNVLCMSSLPSAVPQLCSQHKRGLGAARRWQRVHQTRQSDTLQGRTLGCELAQAMHEPTDVCVHAAAQQVQGCQAHGLRIYG